MRAPFRENETLFIQVDGKALGLSVTHTPDEVLRAVSDGLSADLNLIRKSSDVNSSTDQSSVFRLHVPGEEYLAIIVIVKAVAIEQAVNTTDLVRSAVHEHAKACEVLSLVFERCPLGIFPRNLFDDGRVVDALPFAMPVTSVALMTPLL